MDAESQEGQLVYCTPEIIHARLIIMIIDTHVWEGAGHFEDLSQ